MPGATVLATCHRGWPVIQATFDSSDYSKGPDPPVNKYSPQATAILPTIVG